VAVGELVAKAGKIGC